MENNKNKNKSLPFYVFFHWTTLCPKIDLRVSRIGIRPTFYDDVRN